MALVRAVGRRIHFPSQDHIRASLAPIMNWLLVLEFGRFERFLSNAIIIIAALRHSQMIGFKALKLSIMIEEATTKGLARININGLPI